MPVSRPSMEVVPLLVLSTLSQRNQPFEPSVNGDIQFGNFGFKSYKGSGSMRYNNIGLSVFAQRTQMDAIDRTQNGLTRKEVKNKDGISDRVDRR